NNWRKLSQRRRKEEANQRLAVAAVRIYEPIWEAARSSDQRLPTLAETRDLLQGIGRLGDMHLRPPDDQNAEWVVLTSLDGGSEAVLQFSQDRWVSTSRLVREPELWYGITDWLRSFRPFLGLVWGFAFFVLIVEEEPERRPACAEFMLAVSVIAVF